MSGEPIVWYKSSIGVEISLYSEKQLHVDEKLKKEKK